MACRATAIGGELPELYKRLVDELRGTGAVEAHHFNGEYVNKSGASQGPNASDG